MELYEMCVSDIIEDLGQFIVVKEVTSKINLCILIRPVISGRGVTEWHRRMCVWCVRVQCQTWWTTRATHWIYSWTFWSIFVELVLQLSIYMFYWSLYSCSFDSVPFLTLFVWQHIIYFTLVINYFSEKKLISVFVFTLKVVSISGFHILKY